MLIAFIFNMDHCLKYNLNEQLSAAAVSTVVTDAVSDCERFTSPSNVGTSRNAERSTQRKYSDPYLSLGLLIEVIKPHSCHWLLVQ